MEILLDGFYILNFYKVGIIIFFISVLGIGAWGIRYFQVDNQRTFLPSLPVALSLGSLILILLSFTLVFVGRIWVPVLQNFSLVIPIIGSVAFVIWILKNKSVKVRSALLFYILILLITLFVRLAFLKDIILPPYFDSPTHTIIVQDLLDSGKNYNSFYSLDTITSHYYHFGFHGLAAWFSSASKLDPADSIGLLGQLFLVILPSSVFLLAYSATQNIRAGLVAMLLSAFAWWMPAFASNWGKYPAIVGLSLFPAVVGLWILHWRNPEKKPVATVVLIIATAVLIFVHTRLAVCLVLAFTSFFLVRNFSYIRDMSFWKACMLGTLSFLALVPFQEYISLYYGNGHYLAIVSVLFLLPFAFYLKPRFSLSITLFIFGVWLMSQISVFSGAYSTTLLDGPFIEILLYIPLSIFGGVGFAGLLDRLPQPAIRLAAGLTFLMVITISFYSADSVYPDECCNFVRNSDMDAIQWLDENAGQNAVIWVAAFKNRNNMIETDAGAWVHALTGLNANRLDFDFEWSSFNSLNKICRPGYEDVYIFKGNSWNSFKDKILAEQNWLTLIFTSGETTVYKVKVSCNHKVLD
ncbi:MAG: hypothetical protein QGM50_11870 [Anaerolineae bacterium]|nr:hypothetical protein [Anaerolineae bacterium]